MEVQFYTVKATLERCSRQDFYDNQGFFLQDKKFFLKDYWTKEFIGYYNTPFENQFSMPNDSNISSKNYWIKEINDLLQYNLLYKLSSLHHSTDFIFWLYIKTALETDVFWTNNTLKINTCYYLISNTGIVTGPNYITPFDTEKSIREKFNKKEMLVLSTKQTFEPFKIAAAS